MTFARINGELLNTPRKPRPEHYEQDIDWLLNDAPGLLGETGVSYGEGGSGNRVVVNTDPYHARMHRALPAVAKYRRVNAIWRSLDAQTQSVLAARYAQKRWPAWYVSHFGELVGVVVHLQSRITQLEKQLGKAASNPTKAVSKELLAKALTAAQNLSRDAHREWRSRARELALEWAEGEV